MHLKINPLAMNTTELPYLIALLNSNRSRLIWENHAFSIGTVWIELTHSLILRHVAHDQTTYLVMSPINLQTGSFGQVYPIECALAFKNGSPFYFNLNVPLVIKIQPIRWQKNETWETLENRTNMEYMASQRFSHLSIEPPIYSRPWYTAMVMRRQPGIDLFTYDELFESHWVLDLLVMRCALKAYEEQLLAHNCVHIDIKPQNMIIDIGVLPEQLPMLPKNHIPSRLEINYIDFGFAREYGQNGSYGGDLCFMSPEMKNQILAYHNERVDIFSLGMTFIFLMGGDKKYLAPNDITHNYINELFDRRYSRAEHMTLKRLKLIYYGFQQMIKNSPQQRWDLKKSKEHFTKILLAELFYYISINDIKRLKLILNLDKDLINYSNSEQGTLLHVATHFNRLSIVKYLLESAQIDPNAIILRKATNSSQKQSVLDVALMNTKNDILTLRLMSAGARPHQNHDWSHYSPVIAAAFEIATNADEKQAQHELASNQIKQWGFFKKASNKKPHHSLLMNENAVPVTCGAY